MSIKFQNLRKKINRIRPVGYRYPLGLTPFFDGVANAATNITGGSQTIDSTNAVHTFTSSGFFDNQSGVDIAVEYLIVAGGGGTWAPGNGPGGGGAGGLLYGSGHPVEASANVRVIVGAGGGLSAKGVNSSIGISGVPSSNVEAFGGGYGGQGDSGDNRNGIPGGSGGGSATQSTNIGTAGSGTPGQGNNGGIGATDNNNYRHGGGGGGAGAVGGNATAPKGGNGGNGLEYSISGTPTYYAGGGGGGSYAGSATTGGLGGGGPGANQATGTPGTANRGGGGGGKNTSGGSGIVIMRYELSQGTSSFRIE